MEKLSLDTHHKALLGFGRSKEVENCRATVGEATGETKTH